MFWCISFYFSSQHENRDPPLLLNESPLMVGEVTSTGVLLLLIAHTPSTDTVSVAASLFVTTTCSSVCVCVQ